LETTKASFLSNGSRPSRDDAADISPEVSPMQPELLRSPDHMLTPGTSAASSKEAPPPEHCRARLLQGRRIVIIEDEGITQLQLRKMLRSVGAEVVAAAANGRSGIDAVLRERPDIVLMDIQMPHMNGLDAAETILRSLPVCIVMLTAYSDDDCRQRARHIGACAYVIKPITTESLLPLLVAAFEEHLTAA
jgi:CheY-like chemotaxis protein